MPKLNHYNAFRHLTGANFPSYILLILLFLSCSASFAQVRFYTQVSQVQINEEESFQVQYIIEGARKIESFQTPNYSDFTLEESFDHPNAPALHAKTLQVIDVYTRIAVLTPRKAGHFKIPGAVAVIDGVKMHSNPITVTVTNEEFDQVAEPAVEDESELAPGDRIDQKVRENFFLTAEVSKQECYVGETLMAVYKAFSRLNANSHVSKRPSLTGFSVIEMVDSYDRNPTVEVYHGKAYNTHLIRKVQLFPLQPGNYELEGAEVEGMVHFTKRAGGATGELEKIFDPSASRDSVIPYQVNLKSETVSINVKPLPEEGQPADFEGAVGNFTVSAQADKLRVEEGSTVRIRFDVKGTGNFPLVTAPVVKWPSTVECSEPEIQEKTNPFVFPLSGSKSFVFTVSPTYAGNISIPPSIFSFFDPVSKIYKTVQTNPLLIEVLPRKAGAGLKQSLNPVKNSSWRPEYYWFAIIVFAILGWILYQLLTARRKDGAEQVPVPAKAEQVKPGQDDLLSRTDASLAAGDYKGFLANLQQSLWYAAANKVDKHPSLLNKQNLPVLLRRANLPSEFIHEYIDLLYACEWALYTPETTLHDMQVMRNRAAELFRQLNG